MATFVARVQFCLRLVGSREATLGAIPGLTVLMSAIRALQARGKKTVTVRTHIIITHKSLTQYSGSPKYQGLIERERACNSFSGEIH